MIAKNCETCARRFNFNYEGRAYCGRFLKIRENKYQFVSYYTCKHAYKHVELCDRGKHWMVRIKEMNNES